MTVFPNAKINIGLDITEKRPDGFHNISTIFYPVKIYDALEVIPNPEGELEFTVSGEGTLVSGDDNLCVKAYRLLEKNCGLPPVKMHLHKNIPSGAGLGGGSADAAFTLRLLNKVFGLALRQDELEDYARLLGSDCAFFIGNEPVYAFGKGDEFRPVSLDLEKYYLVVVMPELEVATAGAYKNVTPEKPHSSLEELYKTPVPSWKGVVRNGFEPYLFRKYPEISAIKQTLYAEGALYASVSGSGAAVYGIFPGKVTLPDLELSCRVFYGVN